MKLMTALTTVSLIGIGVLSSFIYSEYKVLQTNKNMGEISSSMYQSIIWQMDAYNNPRFNNQTKTFFDDQVINMREYEKLKSLAQEQSTPMLYISLSSEDLWHTKEQFNERLASKEHNDLLAIN
ncbi:MULTISPECIES: hypothetical protein [unclassified Pseudoalteromonas]|uniref:hypothetical protein n=1 Tax=unclassified Pseudoalteromonas TaxID=194690 RepID=UPI000C074AE7|nr:MULTISPECIES: hypothetical protein [unclassified Pseudoalteromonas]MDB2355865.1 hypothetical protein [Pseudoalteromonas sp.]MDP2634661.1 hypothetical protein [Pseudoalteromonas sp. 1_MG-2023]PHN91196.1 hypothetical protein CSC79_02765 [Pseudoalteromonas sp. 3D05]